MTATTEIKCDACGTDLTYTGNSVDYRLVLRSESKAPWYVKEGLGGGAVTDMMVYPPLPKAHHFCGLGCLDAWTDERRGAITQSTPTEAPPRTVEVGKEGGES